MSRLVLASILSLAPLLAAAQVHPKMFGRMEGDTYVSPTGAFRIKTPLAPGLGGTISDTATTVTFQDNLSVHISIVAVKQDATERWELETRGIKDYLVNFFKTYAFTDFRRTFPGAKAEGALFMPGYLDGSLVAYVLLPGGSMFAASVPSIVPRTDPPVAKRGNLLFIKNGFVFVISTELAERVTEGTAYTKTIEEEDVLLRERLLDIVSRIQFAPQPSGAAK